MSGWSSCLAILWTHWPYSGYLSGLKSARTFLFWNFQLKPPSFVLRVPIVEIAMCCFLGSLGYQSVWCEGTVLQHRAATLDVFHGYTMIRWWSSVTPLSSLLNSAAAFQVGIQKIRKIIFIILKAFICILSHEDINFFVTLICGRDKTPRESGQNQNR